MSEYMRILKMIEDGDISPEDGAKLLEQVGTSPSKDTTPRIGNLGILEKIETGELTAEEGIHFINHSEEPAPPMNELESDESIEPNPPVISEEELERWKRWWTIPLYVGVGIVILSTFWLNAAYQNSQFGFWFFCSWVPLIIGLLVISLSWGSRSGPWIHVRVRGPKERVAISIPAPMGITSWALRNFGHFIPQLENTAIDEILLALESTSKNNTPLYIHVNEGEQGEHVEVFIG